MTGLPCDQFIGPHDPTKDFTGEENVNDCANCGWSFGTHDRRVEHLHTEHIASLCEIEQHLVDCHNLSPGWVAGMLDSVLSRLHSNEHPDPQPPINRQMAQEAFDHFYDRQFASLSRMHKHSHRLELQPQNRMSIAIDTGEASVDDCN